MCESAEEHVETCLSSVTITTLKLCDKLSAKCSEEHIPTSQTTIQTMTLPNNVLNYYYDLLQEQRVKSDELIALYTALEDQFTTLRAARTTPIPEQLRVNIGGNIFYIPTKTILQHWQWQDSVFFVILNSNVWEAEEYFFNHAPTHFADYLEYMSDEDTSMLYSNTETCFGKFGELPLFEEELEYYGYSKQYRYMVSQDVVESYIEADLIMAHAKKDIQLRQKIFNDQLDRLITLRAEAADQVTFAVITVDEASSTRHSVLMATTKAACSVYPDSYFAAITSDRWPPNAAGQYEVTRQPEDCDFEFIVNYLRTHGQVRSVLNKPLSLRNAIRGDLDFFGLPHPEFTLVNYHNHGLFPIKFFKINPATNELIIMSRRLLERMPDDAHPAKYHEYALMIHSYKEGMETEQQICPMEEYLHGIPAEHSFELVMPNCTPKAMAINAEGVVFVLWFNKWNQRNCLVTYNQDGEHVQHFWMQGFVRGNNVGPNMNYMHVLKNDSAIVLCADRGAMSLYTRGKTYDTVVEVPEDFCSIGMASNVKGDRLYVLNASNKRRKSFVEVFAVTKECKAGDDGEDNGEGGEECEDSITHLRTSAPFTFDSSLDACNIAAGYGGVCVCDGVDVWLLNEEGDLLYTKALASYNSPKVTVTHAMHDIKSIAMTTVWPARLYLQAPSHMYVIEL